MSSCLSEKIHSGLRQRKLIEPDIIGQCFNEAAFKRAIINLTPLLYLLSLISN